MRNGSVLTYRQEEILRLAGDGLADKEIARELQIAEGTLRTYWQRMREKTGARCRGEIIARTLRAQCDELRNELQLHELLLKTLPYGIWTVTSRGQFEFWNDWFTNFGGLRSSEISRHGCKAMMLPEDHRASDERWVRALATGEGYDAIVRYIRAADQTLHWHQIRLYPLQSFEGNIERWCGSAQPIAPTHKVSLR